MFWDSSVSLADIFTIISAVAVAGSFIFGIFMLRHNEKIEKSNIVKDIALSFYQNEDYAQTFYKIDYDVSWYSEEFHSDLDRQRKVDSVLTLMSYVCYLKLTKQISDKELKFLNYKLDRTLKNRDVIDYLYNLYHFAKEDFSFYWLLKYAKKHYIWFNDDFFNPLSRNYPHYLNF